MHHVIKPCLGIPLTTGWYLQVADLVDKKHSVDLTCPDRCITIDILTNACLIGIADDYLKLRKFNIMELTGTNPQVILEPLKLIRIVSRISYLVSHVQYPLLNSGFGGDATRHAGQGEGGSL